MGRMSGPRNLFLTCLVSLPLMAADFAPTGTLRAAFLGTNPVQGRVDPQTGAITGPVADLMRELAGRLGVPYKIFPEPDPRAVIDRLKAHTADIGFLAYEAGRAGEVDFSRSYVLMPSTYIVRADSPIRKASDADRAGMRVGAVQGLSQEIYLSANLKSAKVKPFSTNPSAEELEKMLMNGELDAFGANRQRMVDAASVSSKLRVLPDNFFVAEQAIVVGKGDPSRLELINRFLDEMVDSGFVKASLDRAKLAGVEVAPRRTR
jgi:polar amino acid transport system substrate-binding protein